MKLDLILRKSAEFFLTFLPVIATAQPLQLISTSDPSIQISAAGGGDSGLPIISADARFVLFASTANNLVLSSSNRPFPGVFPPPLNLFLRDRASNATTLVSISASGLNGANGNSLPISISTNGQFVLFESSASNLIADDTNNSPDLFVRDVSNKVTFLISAPLTGTIANGTSRAGTMTADGRYVAFLSGATNLVLNDTNHIPDVFVRDLQSNITTLVSVGAKSRSSTVSTLVLPTESAPDISQDGRFVLFSSTATNLVRGVVPLSTTGNEIYLRDIQAGTNFWISGGARPAAFGVLGSSNVLYFNFAISTDGQFVVYQARKSTAYTGLTLQYSLVSGVTQVIHTNAVVTGTGDNRTIQMSPDGRFVTFVASQGTNIDNTTYVLVWDSQTGVNTLVSGNLAGSVPPGNCDWPAVTPDGRFVAFLSSATNLVTNVVSSEFHLYLRDTHMAATTLVDRDTNGIGSSFLSSMPAPSLSADGRYVAFEAPDGSLVTGDNNRRLDVFVSDVLAGSVEMVSVREPTLPSNSPNAPSGLTGASVNANNLYLAFSSDADDLVLNDTNGYRDVFLRDLVVGTNILISVSTNGSSGDGPSTDPTMSADARFVAFSSRADNLVQGDTNYSQDIFIRNLQTGTTVLASVDPSGFSPGSKDSYSPLLNKDGSHLLFRSQAANLVPGTAGENLFLRDLSSATTYALTTNGVSAASMTPDGRFVAFIASNGPSSAVYLWDFQTSARIYTNSVTNATDLAVSPDGNRLVYWVTNSLWADDRAAQTNWLITSLIEATRPGIRFSLDGRFLVYSAGIGPKTVIVTNNQVWLYDFQTGTNLLVSQKEDGSGPGNDNSDSPDISSDGLFVAFRSAATDIVAGDNNAVPDIFVFDRTAGRTSLVSASRYGNYSADNRCLSPHFTTDSRTIIFESMASDLAGSDFNSWSDVYSWSLNTSESLIPFPLNVVRDAQGVRLMWQVLPAKNYRVQFKPFLDDSNWQDLNGNISVFGNRASFVDSTISLQGFYRVIAF